MSYGGWGMGVANLKSVGQPSRLETPKQELVLQSWGRISYLPQGNLSFALKAFQLIG